MPLEGLPFVRTLAEMYELDRKHSLAPVAQQGVTDTVLQQVWMLGASTVVLNLLRFIQSDAPESDPTDPVARVLEAWDAEMLQSVVDEVMVAEKSRRSDSDAP